MKRLIMLFLIVLCITSCGDGGGGGGQDPVPPAVTMTHASISSGNFTLEWIEPDDADLDWINITYRSLAPTESDYATLVNGYTVSALPDKSNSWTGVPTLPGSRYEIVITTHDTDNNEKTVSFKVSVTADSMDYYFIYTAADMNAVRGGVAGYEAWDTVTSGDAGAEGFVLMADLSLKAYSSGEGWVPIGNDTGSFGKIFEGNGHTISGLTINRPAGDYQGLFGYLGGPGIINDLTVQGSVSGQSHVGGLAGTSEGTINNCVSGVAVTGNTGGEYENTGGLVGDNAGGSVSGSSATGTVSGIYHVGGLIGYNDGGTVSGCSATGAVTTMYDFAGGLVGRNEVGAISNSYATGAVTSTNNNAGGLVGAHISGLITNCYATGSVSSPNIAGGLVGNNAGNISYSHATGNVTGESYTGGLIGSMEDGTVSTCYATGSVYASYDVGGLVGDCSGGTITNCYARGSVTSNSTDADDYAAGLVGDFSGGTITYCYSTGAVIGDGNFRGGLVGNANTGPVNCYYDKDTSGLEDTNGAPTSTANMKLQVTFSGWTFPGTWSIDTNSADGLLNNGYPYLTNNAPAN